MLKAIKILAKRLKVSVDPDKLADEWRVYQVETITEDWYIEFEEPQKLIRIDHFWEKVDDLKDAMGERKFPSIMKVVKTALILGHGNAAVERGFSESGQSVTADRDRLSEASINCIRATTDGLKAFKGPGSVPITKQLFQLRCSAHAHYAMHPRQRAEGEGRGPEGAYSTERTSTTNGSTETTTCQRKERLVEKRERVRKTRNYSAI